MDILDDGKILESFGPIWTGTLKLEKKTAR